MQHLEDLGYKIILSYTIATTCPVSKKYMEYLTKSVLLDSISQSECGLQDKKCSIMV